MNEKGNSTKFVVITTTMFVLIGLMFISFGTKSSINSNAIYVNKMCYEIDTSNGKLISVSLNDCCINIKRSIECKPYKTDIVNDQMFLCIGSYDVVANKAMIDFCGD